jgi:hypothetical protein
MDIRGTQNLVTRASVAQPSHWLPLCLLVLCAFALGTAINYRDGLYHPPAVLWLNVAVVSGLIGCWLLKTKSAARNSVPYATAVIAIALACQFVQLYRNYPGTLWNTRHDDPRYELARQKDDERFIADPQKRIEARARIEQAEASLKNSRFQLAILLAAAIAAAGLLPWHWPRHLALPILLAIHFALGVWIIRNNPIPHIDVYVFQQESCAALLNGQNPYAITFPNIYGPHAFVYGSHMKVEDRVNFGFPYMPLSLFLALPGYLIAGDHRYSQLAAMTLAAILIACARPSILSYLAALLYLFTPRSFMVLEMAWTDPFVVLLLAATVFCALRRPRFTPYILGLFLATKQYLLFVPILAILLMQSPFHWRAYLKFLAKAAAVGLLVSAPLILLDPHAFIRSAVLWQFEQPFRKDALSYLAWHAWNKDALGYRAWYAWNFSEHHPASRTWLAFLAAALMSAFALRRCPRSPAGFAAAIAVVYLAFFSLNKQAFCNYYFFVIGAICCAIAASPTSFTLHPANIHQGTDAAVEV